MTNLTELTADKWIGKMFTFLIILRLERNKEIYREDSQLLTAQAQRAQLREVTSLLENMLSFLAFCTRGKLWRVGNSTGEERFKRRCGELIVQLVSTAPREYGNGWNLSKVHTVLDLAYYIAEYWHTDNYDCGIGERNLQFFGKEASKTAQKKGHDSFLKQVCSWLHDLDLCRFAL